MATNEINLTAALKAASSSSNFDSESQANLQAVAEVLENQQGAVYVEYAFLVAFIAMAAAGGVVLMGDRIAGLFDNLATNVDNVKNSMEGLINQNATATGVDIITTNETAINTKI